MYVGKYVGKQTNSQVVSKPTVRSFFLGEPEQVQQRMTEVYADTPCVKPRRIRRNIRKDFLHTPQRLISCAKYSG